MKYVSKQIVKADSQDFCYNFYSFKLLKQNVKECEWVNSTLNLRSALRENLMPMPRYCEWTVHDDVQIYRPTYVHVLGARASISG